MLSDLHTHSYFSPDGHATLEEMLQGALSLGIGYYGISEHFDLDFLSRRHYEAGGGAFSTTDPAAYFPAARKLQHEVEKPEFHMLVGAEFGFCPDPEVQQVLSGIAEDYAPDFIINSVHIIDGQDVYFADFYRGRDRKEAYSRYLTRVLESLDAEFPYDIVGHIGYPSRNAPYVRRAMRYKDHPDLFDAILKKIIEKDKILEVNGSTAGAPCDFLPDTDILERYFALGGRKISYGSDAHGPSRLCQGRIKAVEALKKIGFTSLTIPTTPRTLLPL